MKDMGTGSFPEIPRTPSTLLSGWNTLINRDGAEAASKIINDAFTVRLPGREAEVTEDEGPEQPGDVG